MNDCRIGVVGAGGRMGRLLLRLAATTPGFRLVGGSERKGAPDIGKDLGQLAGTEPLGLALGDDAKQLFAAADAVLDFTAPEASLAHAQLAAARRRQAEARISTRWPSAGAMASPARANPAPSDLPPFAAAMSWASTASSLPLRANASN